MNESKREIAIRVLSRGADMLQDAIKLLQDNSVSADLILEQALTEIKCGRELLKESIYEDMSQGDVAFAASITGLKPGTIKNYVYAGRIRTKDKPGETYWFDREQLIQDKLNGYPTRAQRIRVQAKTEKIGASEAL